jgi:CRP/FNR family transcriptional regulator, dissimilatory nitrate respiration regulator
LIKVLKYGRLFLRLSDEQLQRVAQKAHRMTLKEGETLFHQQDPAERFYLLLSGQIKLFRMSPDGYEKVIEIVTPGCTFAEALMFQDLPRYPVSAEALQNTEVVSIDSQDFADMLRGSADTCFLLLADMSMRLRGLISEIDVLTLHSATSRVASYLLTQAEEEGSNKLELKVSKQTLASRLSVKPETFSRIIKSLNTQGAVEICGQYVHIKNFEELERIADVCALHQDALSKSFSHSSS